jgi:methionine-rich copper-binding protein CopC
MKKALLTTAFIFLLASPAFAHAHLMSEQPADGATVTAAPSLLTLTFSESVALKFTGITLTGPAGAVTPAAVTLDADGTTLSLPLDAPLPAGSYSVAWHALSTDGHKTTGTYAFTVQ